MFTALQRAVQFKSLFVHFRSAAVRLVYMNFESHVTKKQEKDPALTTVGDDYGLEEGEEEGEGAPTEARSVVAPCEGYCSHPLCFGYGTRIQRPDALEGTL